MDERSEPEAPDLPPPTPEDRRGTVRATFDAVAASYDHVGVDFFGPIARTLVDGLDVGPGERALDVGCGRGAVLFPLATAVGSGGEVVGIDLSPAMVREAAAEVSATGLDGIARVVVGDAEEPGVDGPFDLVTASLVLFFLPDPLRALRAWAALLRPGGRMGTTTFGEQGEEWRYVDEVLRAFAPPGSLDPRTRGGGPFASDGAMEQLVTDAGYVDVTTRTWDVEVRFRDAEHWEAWSRSIGQRQFWERVPDHELVAVRTEAGARLEACRDGSGDIVVHQQVRATSGRA